MEERRHLDKLMMLPLLNKLIRLPTERIVRMSGHAKCPKKQSDDWESNWLIHLKNAAPNETKLTGPPPPTIAR
jgi:hypothetical protein